MPKQIAFIGTMILLTMMFVGLEFNPITANESSDSISHAYDSSDIEADKKQPEMRIYYVAFLKRGPKWTAEMSPEVQKVLEGHFAHIEKTAAEGKLALAGPFLEQEGEGALAGMYIFRVDSMEEAQALSKKDPGVQSGRFTLEFYPWYGPSTLSY